MVVYTQGTFDLFHIGHLNLLRRCRKLAGPDGRVRVAVLTDEAILNYKGKTPIIPLQERMIMIKFCKYVDEVVESDIYDVSEAIRDESIDYIVVGSDWAKKDLASHYKVNKDLLNRKLIYLPYTDIQSTTKIKEKICKDL